jgi:ABC-type antimicrobial peptide transport system permease subunit
MTFRQVASTVIGASAFLGGLIGALGITVVWVATWLIFFTDGRGFWGIASLLTTPLLAPVTAWWASTNLGLLAVACVVLMLPAVALQRRYE